MTTGAQLHVNSPQAEGVRRAGGLHFTACYGSSDSLAPRSEVGVGKTSCRLDFRLMFGYSFTRYLLRRRGG